MRSRAYNYHRQRKDTGSSIKDVEDDRKYGLIGLTRSGAMRRIGAGPFAPSTASGLRAGLVNDVPPILPPVDTLHVKPRA